MNKLQLLLQSIRLPNLIMLALVQFIVCQFYVQVYSFSFYFLLVFSTICIALGGYLINDVYDLSIDQANGKDRWVNENNINKFKYFAVALFILGLVLGLSASLISSLNLFTAYVVAVLTLVLYAVFLSRYKLAGNLVVSALIALSILLCFYLGVNHPEFDRKFYVFDELSVWVYAAIAFLLNWIREIVKDLEDVEGDRIGNRHTLPILIGQSYTKGIVQIVLVFFLFIFIYLAIANFQDRLFVIYIGGLITLTALTMKRIYSASKSNAYHGASLFIKVLMLLGLLLPISNHL